MNREKAKPGSFWLVLIMWAFSIAIAQAAPPPGTGNWTLVLDENFNGTDLNPAVWSRGMRWAANINDELQGYVPENVTVANGVCTIKAEKRTVPNVDWVGYSWGNFSYASGAIQTYNKWTHTYGYFEARVKMSGAKGTWPAFWLLPDRGAPHNVYYRTAVGSAWSDGNNSGSCPLGNEIDIFEYMGSWKDPATGISSSHSGHFWSYSGGNVSGYTMFKELPNPDTTYHTYGLYWAPGVLRYYIDGKMVYHDHGVGNIGVCPHYMILNVAMHVDDWTGPELTLAEIDASLPGQMEIDYVRVWSGTAGAGAGSGDIGAVGLPGSHSFNAGSYTVQGSGSTLDGTADSFHFVGQELTGDGTVIIRLNSLTNTHASARAGLMFRESIDDAGSRYAFVGKNPGGTAIFQHRTSMGGGTASASASASGLSWLRLVRSGNSFTGSVSSNGTTWTQVGSQTVSMPSTVFVGLAVSSYNNAALATATFDEFQITPSLIGRDLADNWATPGIPGSTTKNGSVYTIQGSGSGFSDKDKAHFAGQRIAGDCVITARVTDITGGDQYWARAGVMMREDRQHRARSVLTAATPFTHRTFQRRTAYGAYTLQTVLSDGSADWVRLARVGNTFSSYASRDGQTWTLIGSETIPGMAEVLTVGLAVSSNKSSLLTTATFDQVTITGGIPAQTPGGVPVNLAPLGTISGYSTQQSSNPATNLIDDTSATRWAAIASGYPQWIEVDLGSNKQISGTEVDSHNDRDYRFRVEAKPEGGAYSTVVDRTANTSPGPIADTFPAVTARYVKLTITGAHSYTGNWATIREFKIIGQAPASGGALAITGVSASGWEAANPPANSFDGDVSTRWTCRGIPQWIQWDLGAVKTLEQINIAFYKLRRYYFEIQVSADGSAWTPVLTSQTSSGTTLDFESFPLGAVSGRYVRYVGSGSNANTYNNLTEVQILGY